MPAEEWRDKVAVYRRQGRPDDEISGIATYLQRRGPRQARSRGENVARARKQGLVAREEYMDAETEALALAPGPDGLADARLVKERDRLLVTTEKGWVNPKSRTAWRFGLHSFTVRGTSHHAAAAKAGRFTPGAAVRLVREPDNAYATNAIAVYAETARRPAGYVPKGQAKRLAMMLDRGDDLVAISVRGAGAGSEGVAPQVLVTERRLLDRLSS